jgi:carbamoyltransferase
MAFRGLLPVFERFYASKQIFRGTSEFALERLAAVRATLERGETLYLGGIGAAGLHNSGVALVECRAIMVLASSAIEEERFSGKKHTTEFRTARCGLNTTMQRVGIGPERIAAWLGTRLPRIWRNHLPNCSKSFQRA